MAKAYGGKPQADLVVKREQDILGATVDGVPYFGMPGQVKKMMNKNGEVVLGKDGKPLLDGGTAVSLIDDTDQDVVIFLRSNPEDVQAFKDAIANYNARMGRTGTTRSEAEELSELFSDKKATKKEPNFQQK